MIQIIFALVLIVGALSFLLGFVLGSSSKKDKRTELLTQAIRCFGTDSGNQGGLLMTYIIILILSISGCSQILSDINMAWPIIITITGILVAYSKWVYSTAIPLTRSLYLEKLCCEEQRNKHEGMYHTCLRFGLEYSRALYRNELIEKGLATGRPRAPLAIFNVDNLYIEISHLTSKGNRSLDWAKKVPFLSYLNKRYVQKKHGDCLDADRMIKSRSNEYANLRDTNIEEYRTMIGVVIFSEYFETFFYKNGFDGGPIGYFSRETGRHFLIYQGRNIEETTKEEAEKIILGGDEGPLIQAPNHFQWDEYQQRRES